MNEPVYYVDPSPPDVLAERTTEVTCGQCRKPGRYPKPEFLAAARLFPLVAVCGACGFSTPYPGAR